MTSIFVAIILSFMFLGLISAGYIAVHVIIGLAYCIDRKIGGGSSN